MGNYNYIVDDDPDLDEMEEGTLALQFGSHEPDDSERSILDFCSSLPFEDWGFELDTAQNSEYSTGVYLKHTESELLLFIGLSTPLLDEHPDFAFSVGINSSSTLDEKSCDKFGCIRVTDGNDGENWIYVPIKSEIPSAENPAPENLDKNIKSTFKTVGKIIKLL